MLKRPPGAYGWIDTKSHNRSRAVPQSLITYPLSTIIETKHQLKKIISVHKYIIHTWVTYLKSMATHPSCLLHSAWHSSTVSIGKSFPPITCCSDWRRYVHWGSSPEKKYNYAARYSVPYVAVCCGYYFSYDSMWSLLEQKLHGSNPLNTWTSHYIAKDPEELDSDRWIPLRGGARIPWGL